MDSELKVVGRNCWCPWSVGRFFRTIQGQNAMSAAQLRLSKHGGFGFTEGPEFACAAMDDFAWELRIEIGCFGAWARRIRENVEIGKWKRIDEAESGFVVGFGFAGKSGDDICTYGCMRQNFTDKAHATRIVLRAIPAVHGRENVVRAGLERH